MVILHMQGHIKKSQTLGNKTHYSRSFYYNVKKIQYNKTETKLKS